MTRSHVLALLGGLGLGLGIGVLAIFLILNRVKTIAPLPVAATAPAAQAATGATAKPTVHAKARRFKGAGAPGGAQATADSRRAEPPAHDRQAAPIGSGGTIFSGADANDPRVQHFAD